MVEKISKDKLWEMILREEKEFQVEKLRSRYRLDPESNLYVALSRFVDGGLLKRLSRGWYRRIEKIEPIPWWDGKEQERVPFVFPCSHEEFEESSFGFEDNIEVFFGDSIVIAGQSNWGKTAFALNLLVDNLHLFEEARLMVNEYRPARFRKRMAKFDWVDYWNEGKPKFDVLPITENFEDYILPNGLNIIDWLHISADFWKVATQIQDMQMQLRNGLLVVVLQKTRGKEVGVGGDWGLFFPSVYLTLDPPGKLTVIKVKSAPEGVVSPENKLYAFSIIERGSRFHDIREVKNCPKCKGTRYAFGKECDLCVKKGYVELGR